MAFNLGDIFVKIKASTEGLEKGLNKARQGIVKFSSFSSKTVSGFGQKLSSQLENIAAKAKFAAIAAGGGILALGKKALTAAADFESMGVALTTAFQGDAAAAKQAQKEITDFTASTPFQLNEVLGGFIKLKNFGLDPSRRALTAYGDTASAMGKSLDQMVEAVADATTGEFERLKEFGIKSSVEGDRVKFTFRGVTTEVGKNSKEIEEFLIGIGETNFAGGMDDQSQTLNGLLSTLKDNFSLTLAAIAKDSGLLTFAKEKVDFLKEAFNGLLAAMDEAGGAINLLNDYINNSPLLTTLVDKLTEFGDWVSANKETIISFLQGAAIAFGGLFIISTVVSLLTALFSPLNIIIALAGLLSVAWSKNWGDIQGKTAVVAEFIKGAWENTIKPAISAIAPKVQEIFQKVQSYWNSTLKPTFVTAIEWVVRLYQFFKANFDSIMQVSRGAFQVLKGVFQIGFNAIKLILAPFLALITGNWGTALRRMQEAANGIFSGIINIVRGIFNQFVGMIRLNVDTIYSIIVGRAANITDAIVRPFRDAVGKVGEYANKIKEKLDSINPFHRESPSLVDWVEMGAKKITDTYKGLGSSIQGMDLSVTALGNTGGQIPTGTQNIINVKQDINAHLSDSLDVDTFASRLKYKFNDTLS